MALKGRDHARLSTSNYISMVSPGRYVFLSVLILIRAVPRFMHQPEIYLASADAKAGLRVPYFSLTRNFMVSYISGFISAVRWYDMLAFTVAFCNVKVEGKCSGSLSAKGSLYCPSFAIPFSQIYNGNIRPIRCRLAYLRLVFVPWE